jgi:O-antigen ligase
VGTLVVLGALILSPVMLAKLQLILSEGSAFFRQGAELSSVGARLSMWMNSLGFISEAPLLGHGVGSYRFLAEKVFLDPVMCSISCTHPHNQLLFFMVEYGVFGIFIFGMFLHAFFLVLRFWRRRSLDVYAVVAGVLTIFLVDSFINSPLWISSLRNFYIGMFSLIFIGYAIAKKSE